MTPVLDAAQECPQNVAVVSQFSAVASQFLAVVPRFSGVISLFFQFAVLSRAQSVQCFLVSHHFPPCLRLAASRSFRAFLPQQMLSLPLAGEQCNAPKWKPENGVVQSPPRPRKQGIGRAGYS